MIRKKYRTSLCHFFLCAAVLVPPTDARAAQSFIFASVADGASILTTRDAFVQRLSPFDRAARMKTDREVSEVDFLAFVGKNVLEWDSAEMTKVQSALRQISPALSRFLPTLGEAVHLVKTTGDEEAQASSYTRGSAIVLPKAVLNSKRDLSRLLAHEFFHIVSRHYPKFRSILYEAIGFHQCGEVELPPTLIERKITNPDAPINGYCIRLSLAGEPVWVMPILYSQTPKYDTVRRGDLLDYLIFALMVVERGPSGVARPAVSADGPRLVKVNQVTDFYEQVGRNTEYIIDPEEILAENVALLVLGERKVRSPEVFSRIEQALARARLTEASPPQNAPTPARP